MRASKQTTNSPAQPKSSKPISDLCRCGHSRHLHRPDCIAMDPISFRFCRCDSFLPENVPPKRARQRT